MNILKKIFFTPVNQKSFLILFIFALFAVSNGCKKTKKEDTVVKKTEKKPEPKKTPAQPNPFLVAKYDTTYEIPAFDKIKTKHYLPAFKKGMEQHLGEIDKIVNNKNAPDFDNTITALDRSGKLLTRVSRVFFNIASADTNHELEKIKKEITPLLSQHEDKIKFNKGLFKKIKTIYDNREKLELSQEQQQVLKKYYQEFVRGGALLNSEEQKQIEEINKRLSMLKLKYRSNLLEEVKKFEMVIDKKEDLAGLPEGVINAAVDAAKARGHEGKWVFTLDKPSWIPFLQYSPKRKLRKKLYLGYINKGNHDDKLDNKKIISEVAALRVKKAKLLGFDNWATYILDVNMAKNPKNVMKFLNKLWKPSLRVAKKETKALQKIIKKEGKKFKLQSWDWWYYAEKLRKQKYNLDDEQLRPYFKLENVRKGAFYTAKKLYGLEFVERTDLPKYHKDVKTFEVKDKDGKLIGIYLVDYFPRSGKRGGAWMSSYRQQVKIDGKRVIPIIVNVCNFSKPTGDKPALLSFDEVTTLFHEFGHALHGLLSDCSYYKVSGTNVPRDFVELPSQIMEHWALEPEVLKVYAKHYKTGEVIPQKLVDKIIKSKTFNQGFKTTEYLAAAFLDMKYHTLKKPIKVDVPDFEKKFIKEYGLISSIVPRYRSTYFAHVMGGYSAGYYSYIWSALLDNDAFAAFKEKKDIFHQETAAKFRKNILEKGSSREVKKSYLEFRGDEPQIEPLLKNRGLK